MSYFQRLPAWRFLVFILDRSVKDRINIRVVLRGAVVESALRYELRHESVSLCVNLARFLVQD